MAHEQLILSGYTGILLKRSRSRKLKQFERNFRRDIKKQKPALCAIKNGKKLKKMQDHKPGIVNVKWFYVRPDFGHCLHG